MRERHRERGGERRERERRERKKEDEMKCFILIQHILRYELHSIEIISQHLHTTD